MADLVFAALAVAFFISGVEEFFRDLGRWKAIIVPILGTIAYLSLNHSGPVIGLVIKAMATSFVALWVVATFAPEPTRKKVSAGRLPRRVPPL